MQYLSRFGLLAALALLFTAQSFAGGGKHSGNKDEVKATHTVELRRVAFTKWEDHCCGIKIKGNYMKVTYQTFYCNGTSKIWVKEYRS